MIWALESSPPATATQTDTWSGWPQRISRPRAASRVRRQDCITKSYTGWLPFFIVVYCSDATGVDIWIENVQGECLRIRERRQVKVGHVAIGISDQVRDGWLMSKKNKKQEVQYEACHFTRIKRNETWFQKTLATTLMCSLILLHSWIFFTSSRSIKQHEEEILSYLKIMFTWSWAEMKNVFFNPFRCIYSTI